MVFNLEQYTSFEFQIKYLPLQPTFANKLGLENGENRVFSYLRRPKIGFSYSRTHMPDRTRTIFGGLKYVYKSYLLPYYQPLTPQPGSHK